MKIASRALTVASCEIVSAAASAAVFAISARSDVSIVRLVVLALESEWVGKSAKAGGQRRARTMRNSLSGKSASAVPFIQAGEGTNSRDRP